METTHRFFAKLRKLAVTLETESARIQEALEKRNKDDDDSETSAKAMRAYHELKSEVGTIKGCVQDQLSQQKAKEREVSCFIKSCRGAQQRVTEDVDTLRELWEKYGYTAPAEPQRAADKEGDDEEEEEEEEEKEEDESETGEDQASSSVLRTPQLSDFGLSEVQLKRALGIGSAWCADVPPMPEVSLARPAALCTPTLPLMPRTPTRALRMDEAELQSPQMHDFGISEHTMCLYNDFTMNLMQKNINKPQRPAQADPVPPVETLKESLKMKDAAENLKSPEPPVFSTLAFQIKKTKTTGSSLPPPHLPQSPTRPHSPPQVATTPEVPAFQTPYLNRLMSSKKGQQHDEPPCMQMDDDGMELTVPSHNAAPASKRKWEYDLPDISVEDMTMPNLESLLGKSLQKVSAMTPKKACDPEQATGELDGPTQDFSLRTPWIGMDEQEPSTPEMPDLSSVTQDICKLVPWNQKKTLVVKPTVSEAHKISAPSLSVVSESEFQSLPRYLRHVALSTLNQVIHDINKFSAMFPGKKLSQEELTRISKVGTKLPMFILCLTELKRLQYVEGNGTTSVYRLRAHN